MILIYINDINILMILILMILIYQPLSSSSNISLKLLYTHALNLCNAMYKDSLI